MAPASKNGKGAPAGISRTCASRSTRQRSAPLRELVLKAVTWGTEIRFAPGGFGRTQTQAAACSRTSSSTSYSSFMALGHAPSCLRRLNGWAGRRRKVALDRSPWYARGGAIGDSQADPAGPSEPHFDGEPERGSWRLDVCEPGGALVRRPSPGSRVAPGPGLATRHGNYRAASACLCQQRALKQTGPAIGHKTLGMGSTQRRATRPTSPAVPRRSTSRSPSRESSRAPSAASGFATNRASHSLASQRTTTQPGHGSPVRGALTRAPPITPGPPRRPEGGSSAPNPAAPPRARRRRWRPSM